MLISFHLYTDLGKCPKEICDNPDAHEVKRKYDQVSQDEKNLDGYEYDLMLFLDDLVRGCDLKVQRNQKRAEKDLQISEENLEKLTILETQYRQLNDLCCEAIELNNGYNIDIAQDYAVRYIYTFIDIHVYTRAFYSIHYCYIAGVYSLTLILPYLHLYCLLLGWIY